MCALLLGATVLWLPGEASAVDEEAVLLHERGQELAQEGEYEAALEAHEAAYERDPHVPGLELGLGHALHELGQYERAQAHLEVAVERAPDDKRARRLLEANSSRMQAAPAAADKRWDLEVGTGFSYDDNVTVSEVDQTSGESDVSFDFDLGLGYRILDQAVNGVGLDIRYDFFHNFYESEDDFNLMSHSLALTSEKSIGRFDTSLSGSFLSGSAGGDGFLDVYELRPGVGLPLLSRWYANTTLRLQKRDFDDSDRDAFRTQVQLDSFVFPSSKGRFLLAGLRFTDEDADASRFDYQGLGLRTGVTWPFQAGEALYQLEFRYDYERRDYDSVTPSIATEREDRIHSFRTELSRELFPGFAAELVSEYSDSDSNLPESDYDQLVISVGFRFAL